MYFFTAPIALIVMVLLVLPMLLACMFTGSDAEELGFRLRDLVRMIITYFDRK